MININQEVPSGTSLYNIKMKKYDIQNLSVKVFETNDTYYAFIAKFNDDWNEIRGYYDGYEIHPEEMIIGHGGFGRSASYLEMDECFEEVKDTILKKVESAVDNGFVINPWADTFWEDNLDDLESGNYSPDNTLGLMLNYF